MGSALGAISKPKWWLGVLRTILLACAAQVCGQSAISEWQGVVRNGNGTPVSGAIVRLAGGSKAEAKSGVDGWFKLPPLPVGKYHLTIETDQHKVDYAAPMELSAASPAVTITLSADYQITVAIPNEQSGATGGEELSSKQVSQLPLNKRDFSQLLLLAAGAMTDANGPFRARNSKAGVLDCGCLRLAPERGRHPSGTSALCS